VRGQFPPHRFRAGEDHVINFGVRQRAAHLARGRQRLHQLRREIAQQLPQNRSTVRGHLGRFPDHAVARRQRLHDLDAVEQEWVIPGADDADDAARPAVDHVALAPKKQRPIPRGDAAGAQQGNGVAFQEPARLGQWQHLGGHRFGG
jgi:hypothetical protein